MSRKILFISLVALALALLIPVVVLADTGEQPDVDVPGLPPEIAAYLESVGGIGLLAYILAQIAKRALPDGWGGRVALIIVVLIYSGLVIASEAFGVDLAAIGESVRPVALILEAALSFAVSVGAFHLVRKALAPRA